MKLNIKLLLSIISFSYICNCEEDPICASVSSYSVMEFIEVQEHADKISK